MRDIGLSDHGPALAVMPTHVSSIVAEILRSKSEWMGGSSENGKCPEDSHLGWQWIESIHVFSPLAPNLVEISTQMNTVEATGEPCLQQSERERGREGESLGTLESFGRVTYMLCLSIKQIFPMASLAIQTLVTERMTKLQKMRIRTWIWAMYKTCLRNPDSKRQWIKTAFQTNCLTGQSPRMCRATKTSSTPKMGAWQVVKEYQIPEVRKLNQ